ncbi:MAG: chemotaxis protein, partial [Burkholderiales bacterium]
SMIDNIAAAAGAQRNEIEQVNDAVSRMDSMTQQNAALVEEAAVASERMRENAHELSTAVAVFKVGNDLDNEALNQALISRETLNKCSAFTDSGAGGRNPRTFSAIS